jgi:PTH1 family peptidyl-tRNA hydrolase
MTIKLIVGLRNPGAAYEHTRHNAGGWFLQALAEHERLPYKINKKMQGEVAEIEHPGGRCYALLPLTFMNHSGQAVRALSEFYRILPHEILVAHDELDLPAGRAKLKTGGGHGGHNGLRDIIAHLGTTEFHRLRLGIGHPGHKDMVLDYVLGKPSLHDKQQILESIDSAIQIVPLILENRLAAAMNQLHSG